MKVECFRRDLLISHFLSADVFNANLPVKHHDRWALACMTFPPHLFRLRDRVHLHKKAKFKQHRGPVICPQCKTELCPLDRQLLPVSLHGWRVDCLPDNRHFQFPKSCQQPSSLGQVGKLWLLLPDHGRTAACSLWAAAAKAVTSWKWSICSAAGWTLEELSGNSEGLKSTCNWCLLQWTLRVIIYSSVEFKQFLRSVVSWCSIKWNRKSHFCCLHSI